ncbi:TPR Domain containing protein [Tritrichomonas foetus]|uniref:TPR Domain containing protein n=1 Tax=Tritrichomonas foetus TaxID=1144522 RepID=A0A1J4K7M8_9EUKA|nr:TPR Domain containing protein [Tritrichomonas foetus]|eukprot:OHT05421.1 TPR Domain containing protein [Tritrichomonas foetus]
MNRIVNSRNTGNIIKPSHPPKSKSTIGCYPIPAAHAPPPDFGPNCVPAAVARQIDAHFAARKKAKLKKVVELPSSTKDRKLNTAETEANSIADRFALCVPQNPQRFSSMNVQNPNNHPCQSILQNPQRIVADGPFAINEAVKPSVVSLQFDGLQPLRLNSTVSNPDVKKTLRDLHLLVQASLRSRNVKDEASAYFNIGLLYESEGHLKRANDYYLKYLQTLGADADPLVFNRIAVNYQLLHRYDDAIEWNMRHLSFSRSMFETIAANCNIALIYKALGDNAKSVDYYKSALETASEMEETEDSPFFNQIKKIRTALADQIELANSESKVKDLGSNQLSAHSFGDRLERSDINRRQIDAQEEYYQSEARISRDQGDLSTAYGALISCGKLNCVYGDFEQAEKFYCEALEIAKQIGSSELINHVKVAIGIVRGNRELKTYGLFDDVGIPDISLFSKELV